MGFARESSGIFDGGGKFSEMFTKGSAVFLTWAEISAQAKNHQSAWEKVNGRKFALVEYHQSA